MKRMLVWCDSKARMEHVIKNHFGGRKCKFEAAANGHGYWVRQPGAAKEFPGGEIRVMFYDFREVGVTVGKGDTRHIVRTTLAEARALQVK